MSSRQQKLEAALRLALEYWGHRQQRYKNRHPVWVKTANDALATPPDIPPLPEELLAENMTCTHGFLKGSCPLWRPERPATSEWNEAIEAAASVGTLYPSQRASIPRPQAQGAVMSETLRTDNAEYINIRFARELERDLMRAMKERDEWKAKAGANERDAERYKVVRENIGWILGDQDGIAGCAYSCQLPLATIDTSSEAELLDMVADFCRSAEKEK